MGTKLVKKHEKTVNRKQNYSKEFEFFFFHVDMFF